MRMFDEPRGTLNHRVPRLRRSHAEVACQIATEIRQPDFRPGHNISPNDATVTLSKQFKRGDAVFVVGVGRGIVSRTDKITGTIFVGSRLGGPTRKFHPSVVHKV